MARLLLAPLVLLLACSSPPVPVPDLDGDGFSADVDCDDGDPTLNPGVAEVCDLVDNDCDGAIDERLGAWWYADADGDGFGDSATETLACVAPDGFVDDKSDCDDASAAVHPGAVETCDGVDENCDGVADDGGAEVPWYLDEDGDGLGTGEPVLACEAPTGWVADDGDCDDGDADVGPEQTFFLDVDGDGHGDPAAPVTACTAPPGTAIVGDDCNDAAKSVHPGAPELCNGIDDNCTDGENDVVDLTFYADVDKDGYGDPVDWVTACKAPAGYVLDATDCDDGVKAVHPGAAETCDGVDTNCSGDESDAAGAPTWHADADRDGYGASAVVHACTAPVGYIADGTDCDDAASAVHPGAVETCNGVDNNCAAGEADAANAATWYADGDADGYGNPARTAVACTAPVGYIATAGDCNDGAGAVHPGAVDVCNGVDDNCAAGETDATDRKPWYADTDLDGYGNAGSVASACVVPNGYVGNSTDCDDGAKAVHPGAVEICNGIDDNCVNGEADAIGIATWYADVDGDGYGDAGVTRAQCAPPTGFVADATDCNDAATAIHPGAVDVCNGIDDNCANGESDATNKPTWYLDADGDTYGTPNASVITCYAPVGYEADALDCDDAASGIHPGAIDACDGIDNNCSGDEVDAIDAKTWYRDVDGDQVGALASGTTKACAVPVGFDDQSTDCNDGAAAIYPGAAETCNGVDNNCSGDELDATDGITWYLDGDGDGYGLATTTLKRCTKPVGYDNDALDCNDAVGTINPGATEICDGIDNNCDGSELQITALYFDSAADTVSIGSTTGLALGGTFTVEAWVYRVGAGGAVFEKWKGGAEDKSFTITGSNTVLGYAFAGYFGPSDPRNYIMGQSDPVAVASGRWSHIAWVYTGSATKYYIDGALATTAAETGDPADSDGIANIGGIYRDSMQVPPMMGYIAEVRISNNVRYNATFAPAPSLANDINTVGLWHLTEGSGTFADDVSTANLNGTIANASWQSVVCRR